MSGALAIGRLLLWPLKGVWRGLEAALRWALADWRHAMLVALAILSAVVFAQRNAARAEAREWEKSAAAWRGATFAWRSTYHGFVFRVAERRAEAAAADRRNAERVAAEQQVIIERTKNDYEARLADTRAALRELRDRLGRTADPDRGSGGGGDADLPGSYTARCQAFGAADCDALLAALPERLAAAEDNTAKLIALQNYVRGLLAIDWSGEREVEED